MKAVGQMWTHARTSEVKGMRLHICVCCLQAMFSTTSADALALFPASPPRYHLPTHTDTHARMRPYSRPSTVCFSFLISMKVQVTVVKLMIEDRGPTRSDQ